MGVDLRTDPDRLDGHVGSYPGELLATHVESGQEVRRVLLGLALAWAAQLVLP